MYLFVKYILNLNNYEKIKSEHKKLKEYLALKNKLIKFCKGESIDYEDFEFNKI